MSEYSTPDDISLVEKFIFDELAVRIQSADPCPDPYEEESISEARKARLAFARIIMTIIVHGTPTATVSPNVYPDPLEADRPIE